MANIIHFPNTEGIDQKMVEIAPTLWQTSRGPAQSDEILTQYNVKHVLSVTAVTLAPIRSANRWTLAIDDNLPWLRGQIEFVVAFCNFANSHEGSAIIHCDHGASRSSGAVILWLMTQERLTREEAWAKLHLSNPYANPHAAIIESLPDRYDPTENT
jgi:predicted protein tyrosine phosphatase